MIFVRHTLSSRDATTVKLKFRKTLNKYVNLLHGYIVDCFLH